MPQIGESKSVNKAKLITERGEKIVLQFNPSEYSFSEDVVYTGGGGNKGDLIQFAGYRAKTLNLTFHFDTSSVVDVNKTSRSVTSVKEKTDEIENLTKVVDSLHRPESVRFLWGEIDFSGVVTSVKTTFTLFTKEGIPIRAKVLATIQAALVDPNDREKLALYSPDRTKARVVSEDMSLWTLAQNEYGDMNEWRRIAKANDILNPFEIETGKVFKIPALVEED